MTKSVWVHDDPLASLRLRKHCVRESFLHDQAESEPMSDLGEKISDNNRFSGPGHAEQDPVLWSVPQPCSDSDKIPFGSVVNRFGFVQMSASVGNRLSTAK